MFLGGDLRGDSTVTNIAIIEGRVNLGIELTCDLEWPWLRLIEVAGSNSVLRLGADLVGGCGGLRKTGSGELSLSGRNRYLGLTLISEGVLSITHGQALGDPWQGTVVELGASLTLAGVGVTVTNEALALFGEQNRLFQARIARVAGVQARTLNRPRLSKPLDALVHPPTAHRRFVNVALWLSGQLFVAARTEQNWKKFQRVAETLACAVPVVCAAAQL